ncbi:hypothetical protein L916_18601 [Phytophthora nicotianae]|uniref:Uncharacterized protein n=1 Tax=Phytophthora nicotianae TaxID=4792 RepID=W2I1B9_PHYNI|nr:hypothetical protein L916_18601 [Phytophthora nicotianae]
MRELLKSGSLPKRKPVLTTLAEVRDKIKHSGGANTLGAVIRMRVIWISRHNYGNSDILKLHLIDAETPETLDELYRASWTTTMPEQLLSTQFY